MSLIRLNEALNWINIDDSLADIGCDHGYLSIEALKKGLKFVQLIDNKQGPLSQAKKNLEKNELYDNYVLTLSSGLNDLDDKVDTVAILGMGGDLISKILEADFNKVKVLKKVILCAHTKVDSLRKYLSCKKIRIIEEKIVKENDKYYELMLVKYDENAPILDYKDILLGPILSVLQPPLFKEKWEQIYQKYCKIIEKNDKILEELERERDLIGSVLWPK